MIEHQGYLQDAPFGVGALKAWALSGGSGTGITVVLYDNGLRTTHEDLPALMFTIGGADHPHGTASMSVMAARHDGIGLSGIAHGAGFGFVRAAAGFEMHGPMLPLLDMLAEGDVVLIEIGTVANGLGFECPANPSQANQVPLEFKVDVFMAVQQLLANGITVVTGAGNGCVDFDSQLFAESFGDGSSGSLWVGAANSGFEEATPFEAAGFTGYGERVGLYAWGRNVAAFSFDGASCIGYTPENPCSEWLYYNGDEDRKYVNNFRGTSSASAIVAGAAAAVQSFWLASHGSILSPSQLRDLLVATGSPQGGDVSIRPIGVMPDLKAAMIAP